MDFVRLLLIAATILASLLTDAKAVTLGEGAQPRAWIGQHGDMVDAFDNMTPDEISALMGLPNSDEFDAWLESHPELLFTPASGALVDIRVSLQRQRLYVGYPEGRFEAPVSSGRNEFTPGTSGYRSKRGCFTPYTLQRMHYSRAYNNAPMPNALFYYGGFAIHATNEEGKLGRPASHGCVRVSHKISRTIYDLVTRYGRANTRVCVCWDDCSTN